MISSPSYNFMLRLGWFVLAAVCIHIPIGHAASGIAETPGDSNPRPGFVQADPLRISSLNQCYDALLEQPSLSSVQLQSSAEHGGRVERILRFQPDLVLANRFNNPLLVNALLAQGQRVEILPEPDSLAQVEDFFAQLAQLTGVPFAINTDQLPQLFAGQRVLMLQANHYSFGTETLWNELVEALGGHNVAPGSGLVSVLPEQVLRLDPDLIVVLEHAEFALAARNLLHGALAPLLNERAVAVDADLVGCMAQRLDALIENLVDGLAQRAGSLEGTYALKEPTR